MKKIFNLLMLTALMAACACNPSNEQNQGDPSAGPSDSPSADVNPSESPEPPQGGTYKFVASAMKEKWVPGDQIYVHGSIGAKAQTVTLAAEDISADGKTATAQLQQVTTSAVDPDGLYAAYPDDAILHYAGKSGVKTTFTATDRLLCVSYLEGDTFTFTDITSPITFTVTGDFEDFAFGAGNRDGLIVTKLEVEHTSATKKYTVKSKDGSPFVSGKVESGKEITIWVIGNTTLKGGYSIYFGKDEEWSSMYKVDKDTKIPMGGSLAIGDITSSLTSYDGGAPKMPVMGEITKYSVKFNELSGICLSKDEDFLWVVGDQGELGKVSLEGELLDKVVIRTGSPGKGNNWSVDAEGVTVNPETGDLIISAEANSVVRIPAKDLPTAFDADTCFAVKEMFHISAASDYGNSGTEGCSYYKDGMIFVGAQEHAHLFCCEISSGKVLWNKRLNDIFPAIDEIAGLSYDPVTDWLWIIDSNV
ncbi:MAG: SdiA-regulated domain-containing protein, partial [Bacteroidales bacterium]|nr:SdiA-regulated domain-containing protein [Bacteroidales bacterium]